MGFQRVRPVRRQDIKRWDLSDSPDTEAEASVEVAEPVVAAPVTDSRPRFVSDTVTVPLKTARVQAEVVAEDVVEAEAAPVVEPVAEVVVELEPQPEAETIMETPAAPEASAPAILPPEPQDAEPAEAEPQEAEIMPTATTPVSEPEATLSPLNRLKRMTSPSEPVSFAPREVVQERAFEPAARAEAPVTPPAPVKPRRDFVPELSWALFGVAVGSSPLALTTLSAYFDNAQSYYIRPESLIHILLFVGGLVGGIVAAWSALSRQKR